MQALINVLLPILSSNFSLLYGSPGKKTNPHLNRRQIRGDLLVSSAGLAQCPVLACLLDYKNLLKEEGSIVRFVRIKKWADISLKIPKTSEKRVFFRNGVASTF